MSPQAPKLLVSLPPQLNYTVYAGRWLAIFKQDVIGFGQTQAQAFRAAKHNQPKAQPWFIFVDSTGLPHPQPPEFDVWLNHPLLKAVLTVLPTIGQTVYLVGGAVRDGLLGQLAPHTDLDLLVSQKALHLTRHLADRLDGAYYPLDTERDVGRVVLPDQNHLDIAAFRGHSLLADLQGRDFTINAIALRLTPGPPLLLDPLGGLSDLHHRRLQLASPHSLHHDPLRLLRVARFASKLNLSLSPSLTEKIPPAIPRLTLISGERQRDEFLKLCHSPQPSTAFHLLQTLNLLEALSPALAALPGVAQSPPHYLPVFEHTLKAMDVWAHWATLNRPELAFLAPWRTDLLNYLHAPLADTLSRAEALPLALLLHDVGKPSTAKQAADGRTRFWGHPQAGANLSRDFLNHLRFSKKLTQFVVQAVEHHMRPLFLASQTAPSRRAIYRFLRDTHTTAPAIALLSLCDHQATYPPGTGQSAWQALCRVVATICQHYFTPKPDPLLTGRDLITELGIAPGPRIGQLLAALAEAQALGDVTTRSQATAFIHAEAARLQT